MIKKIVLFLSIGFIYNINAQENLNMELVSVTSVNETGNDVWGYVDANGLEYAIMGSNTKTTIWSLEDPTKPTERAVITGDNSTWRDIKHWEDHLYVTADNGNDGLLVIDMSMAPDSIRSHYITPNVVETPDTSIVLGRCHNLYIDEFGFAYLAGSRIAEANKAIIMDLKLDKWNPPIVGYHSGYAHDLYVKNNTMYSSEINEGNLSIYDVTRKDSIVLLGSTKTSFLFTHNAWTSEDQNLVFTTDEKPNAYVDAYDISDLSNIIRLDKYHPQETENRGVIPHNTHYKDGFLVTSFYTDGVVVIDGTNPTNLIKVGSYDTYLGADGGFDGCWGAYPFLPSGLVLASDRQTGLYILTPSYQRASFLEGTVTDALDGTPINNVSVNIMASQVNSDVTNAAGEYKTGLGTEGTYDVVFSNIDYISHTETVDLSSGNIYILDVQLDPLEKVTTSGRVIDATSGLPISNAIVQLVNNSRQYNLSTDDNGTYQGDIIADSYDVFVGSWGHVSIISSTTVTSSASSADFELLKGYHDDFFMDLGWQTFTTATTGEWVREVPIGTFNSGIEIAPGYDDPFDIGTECYVTGNGSGDFRDFDVDDGVVVLSSPNFTVSDMTNPILRYKYWFMNFGGNGTINDTLFVNVCDELICENVASYIGEQNQWSELVEIPLKESGLDLTKELRVEFITSDFSNPQVSGHIVEAAIDAFSVIDMVLSATQDIQPDKLVNVYPNPFESSLTIDLTDKKYDSYEIYDVKGVLLKKGQLKNIINVFDINVTSGIYTLKLNDIDGQQLTKTIVKK